MKTSNTKRMVRIMSFILFFSVLSVWVIFYFIMSNYIANNTRNQMALAANQIIERLGGEFTQVEKLLYNLKRNDGVKALARESNPDRYVPLISSVNGYLESAVFSPDFFEHIIIFQDSSRFFRLAGNLGNLQSSQLYSHIMSMDFPNHLAISLDGSKYIGYADSITLTERNSGAAVILIAEEKILDVLRNYDQSGSLLVAIKANGEIVASNTDNIHLFTQSANHSVVNSRLGITPYEILVTAQSQFINASVIYFTIVALITAAIFSIVIFIYADVLNRRFFRPMVMTISSIDSLDTERLTLESHNVILPHVQSEEFDWLIDKINAMLLNIDKKNTEVKTAEIGKQKALVFSLKKQINAHFTINTLNTIRMLVERGELEKAESVSGGLISLIRYAYDEDELINIWEELGVLDNYAYIMNSRYDNKFEIDFDFDDRLMKYLMPRMILQPLLENSIEHGFVGMASGCTLSVKAELENDIVSFIVSDNGRGMRADALSELHDRLNIITEGLRGYENIALLNIKSRLHHYYGTTGHLALHTNDGAGFKVTVSIPAIKETEGKK